MRISTFVLASVGWVVTACSDPFFDSTEHKPPPSPPPDEPTEVCEAGDDWLPKTPDVELYKPPAHPAGECPFYRASWQYFMISTQPDENGEPALKAWGTIDDVFKRTHPRPKRRAWLGDIKQAGARQILIDQNGRPIYYGIHVNKAFADFVAENHLETADAIRTAPAGLFLPGDIVELKSAWQEIDEDDPSAAATYITTRTLVSRLHQVDGQIVEDHSDPREVTVRLIALHVAFTLPGHPELIWSTFEHTQGGRDRSAEDGKRDVAPIPPHGKNPKLTDPNNLQDDSVVSADDYVLFKGGTRVNEANQAIAESELTLDEDTQTFPGAQTSIYRMYPASKSNTTDPDDAISAINESVQTLFKKAGNDVLSRDKRGYYRLVGALWMDKPDYFETNATLVNDESSPFADRKNYAKDIQENGSDSELSLLAGEDRLSSTAMESFSQSPAAFPNCFSCHNTQAVTEKGVPIDRDRQGTLLIEPKQINVSHVFSQFVMDEVNGTK